MSIDVLSNMLSSIKNASLISKPYLEVVHTKECEHVANVLKEAGYLSDVKVFKESNKPFKMLRLDISYDDNGISKINDIKRVSKPGRRVYKKHVDLRRVMNGYGMAVVSTNRGVMSDSEARKRKLGGEVVCEVH